MPSYAKIIADSISPLGYRVTTMEVRMHRFVLAEFNTHRVFSRNSASSRAIPVEKQLARLLEEPAFPLKWNCEQPGMQGGSDLEGIDLELATELFEDVYRYTTDRIQEYLDTVALLWPTLTAKERKAHTLHKGLINRLMEPFMWHTVVVTSTEWEGFWHQRASSRSPLAQPEIAAAADLMLAAYEASVPKQLAFGEWHLPYVTDEDWVWAEAYVADHDPSDELWQASAVLLLRQVSSACCARTSYLTQDGVRDREEDLRLHSRLVSARPLHASPMEHPATPASQSDIDKGIVLGNLRGFNQYRHLAEGYYGGAPA